jgi:hypothetical protein
MRAGNCLCQPHLLSRVASCRCRLQIGDRLTDETGEYEVIGRPFTTAGGKTANVRVKRVESDAQMIRVYGAHERVAVKRTGGAA